MSGEARLLEPWVRLARRRWRTGAAIFGAILVLGTMVLLFTRPIYQSQAALRLGEPPPPGGVSPSGGLFSLFQMGGDPFANDLELLGSRSLAEAVVEREALNASLVAPRGWHRDSLFDELRASRDTEEATFELRWREDRRLDVRRTAPSDSMIGTFDPGALARFGGLVVSVLPWRGTMPREFELTTVRFPEATRVTRSALRFERPRREANIVRLSYNDPDPGLANGVVDATVAEFVRLRTALQHRESTQAADSLRTVARRTALELREAEDALEELQRVGRLVAPTAQSEALVERQTALLSALARARGERSGVDLMLQRLDAVRDPARSWTALLSYPAFLDNETLGSMLMQLTELHGEREELATRRTPDNTRLRLLDERITYLDRSLREIAREYRAGLSAQIASIEPQIEALDRLLEALPREALELGRRQRDVRLLSEVLLLTEQRLRQEELREALTYANVQVVDPPALLDRPIWPRKKLGLAVLLVLASGSGLLGMVVRDRTDPRLRRSADVEGSLGRPLLAVVTPRPDGGLRLDGLEVEALARRAGASRNGRTLSLVALDREEAARALANGAGIASEPGLPEDGSGAVRLLALGPALDLRGATAVADAGAPAILVLQAGETTREAAGRAARLIEEAGGTVAGAILICRNDREARRAWE